MTRTSRAIAAVAVVVAVSIPATSATAYETEAPRPTVERTERYEARVPVCLEDERAIGSGDYLGAESGGWSQWECVHIDALADFPPSDWAEALGL
jgi:hypothetical protein